MRGQGSVQQLVRHAVVALEALVASPAHEQRSLSREEVRKPQLSRTVCASSRSAGQDVQVRKRAERRIAVCLKLERRALEGQRRDARRG